MRCKTVSIAKTEHMFDNYFKKVKNPFTEKIFDEFFEKFNGLGENLTEVLSSLEKNMEKAVDGITSHREANGQRVEFELPGFSKEFVRVQVSGKTLIVKAHKTLDHTTKKKYYEYNIEGLRLSSQKPRLRDGILEVFLVHNNGPDSIEID
jgi:HSP20 family molecular chaperone IbpA